MGRAHDAADTALAEDWLALLHAQAIDFTLAWRLLADAAVGDGARLQALFADTATLHAWLARWRERCARDEAAGGPSPAERASRMRQASPWVIPRNHRVEEALNAAMHDGDLVAFEQLLAALRRPFEDDPSLAPFAQPAPPEVTAGFQTFCGT